MELININNTEYAIVEGLSNAILKAFQAGADIVIKKSCTKCGFQMPRFSGRYPKYCPACGNEFKVADGDITETFGAFIDGQCVGLLEKTEIVDEGKFSEIDISINDVVDWTMELIDAGTIKNKADLNKHIKQLKKQEYIPKGIDIGVLQNNLSEVIKRIGKKIKDANVKL